MYYCFTSLRVMENTILSWVQNLNFEKQTLKYKLQYILTPSTRLVLSAPGWYLVSTQPCSSTPSSHSFLKYNLIRGRIYLLKNFILKLCFWSTWLYTRIWCSSSFFFLALVFTKSCSPIIFKTRICVMYNWLLHVYTLGVSNNTLFWITNSWFSSNFHTTLKMYTVNKPSFTIGITIFCREVGFKWQNNYMFSKILSIPLGLNYLYYIAQQFSLLTSNLFVIQIKTISI